MMSTHASCISLEFVSETVYTQQLQVSRVCTSWLHVNVSIVEVVVVVVCSELSEVSVDSEFYKDGSNYTKHNSKMKHKFTKNIFFLYFVIW